MSQRRSDPSRDQLYHRLTIVTLALTALVSVCYLAAFISPSLFGGLLSTERATPTLAIAMSSPTPRPTVVATDTSVPTWTSLPTRTPRPTETPQNTPTATRTPGPTPTFPPTWTPLPTVGTPPPTRSNYPFALRDNELIYTQYFFSSDCNWLGIAGLVVDRDDNPITGLPVVLNGGGFQNHVTYSGNAPAYGESGWEHFLDNKVKEGDFTIQLYSNEPQPISDQIQVHPRADCRTNLIMIILEKNWDEYTP
ncbi:MAG: hypothetical protein JSV36_15715 [Anaerolineae bacterium]|nr:MAG: hypothetical protein JSV36_15715 [Anaerolineae bacterium]